MFNIVNIIFNIIFSINLEYFVKSKVKIEIRSNAARLVKLQRCLFSTFNERE